MTLDLQLFTWNPGDPGTPVVNPINTSTQNTSGASMSPVMRDFYFNFLLENVREKEVYKQFAQHGTLHGSRGIFVRANKFAHTVTSGPAGIDQLQEGVIPAGKSFGFGSVAVDVTQHGGWASITDRLKKESSVDVLYALTEELAAHAKDTHELLTRNKIEADTDAMAHYFCPKIVSGAEQAVTARSGLNKTARLTPNVVSRLRANFRKRGIPTFDDGRYVLIVNPDVVDDMNENEAWKELHKYNDTDPIWKGEIGTLHGFRFVESAYAKINTGTGCPEGLATYTSWAFGKNAFGDLDVDGEGLEMYIKSESEVGGPIEQFSTAGFKFCHAAKLLYSDRLVFVESCTVNSDTAEAN